MARYECEQCGYEREVDDALIGQEATCPACEAVNVVGGAPADDAVQPAPPAAEASKSKTLVGTGVAVGIPAFVVSEPAPASKPLARVELSALNLRQGVAGFKCLFFGYLGLTIMTVLLLVIDLEYHLWGYDEYVSPPLSDALPEILWGVGLLASAVLIVTGLSKLLTMTEEPNWQTATRTTLALFLFPAAIGIIQAALMVFEPWYSPKSDIMSMLGVVSVPAALVWVFVPPRFASLVRRAGCLLGDNNLTDQAVSCRGFYSVIFWAFGAVVVFGFILLTTESFAMLGVLGILLVLLGFLTLIFTILLLVSLSAAATACKTAMRTRSE